VLLAREQDNELASVPFAAVCVDGDSPGVTGAELPDVQPRDTLVEAGQRGVIVLLLVGLRGAARLLGVRLGRR